MEVNMLGPFDASLNGKPITPTAGKLRQVFAILAMRAGQLVTVATLVEEVWGADLPPSAMRTIQTYILQLRRLIGTAMPTDGARSAKHVLLTRPTGYTLDVRPDAIDAHRYLELAATGERAMVAGDFEAASEVLHRALDLWRGPVLMDTPTGPQLGIDVIRLDQSRLSVLESRIDADLRLRRHHELLGELAELVARYPMHEKLCSQYGGTSVATLDHIRRAAQRVTQARQAGKSVVVVVSARGDTTDDLVRLARQVAPTQPPRELDQLLATGECVSAALLASALHGIGTPAVSLTGAQAGVRVTGRHCSGVIEAIDVVRIRRLLDAGKAVVVAGFQGINADGDVVTLGRGGSDTTAVAIAAALGAGRCEVFTDVDGVYTADPRIVPAARALPLVDTRVMAEMAFAGARVLHPRSVELASTQHVELHVRGALSAAAGTVVRTSGPREVMENRGAVVAVTHDANLARVLLSAPRGGTDLAAEVLTLLARHDVPADLVARSGTFEEFRMGFTIGRDEFDDCHPALSRLLSRARGKVESDLGVGKLSFVGMGLLNRPEYTARALGALTGEGIDTSWLSTSQHRISAVVPSDRLTRAAAVLHDEFRLAGQCDRDVAA